MRVDGPLDMIVCEGSSIHLLEPAVDAKRVVDVVVAQFAVRGNLRSDLCTKY